MNHAVNNLAAAPRKMTIVGFESTIESTVLVPGSGCSRRKVSRGFNCKLLRACSFHFLLVLVLHSNSRMTLVQPQEIGQDICGCSPKDFTFNLDFGLTCPPTNITSGGGVGSVSCLIAPFMAPTSDFVPIVVESISILELDQSNSVLVEERIDGTFIDGETFSYTSVLNNTDFVTSYEKIPRALQMNLNGRNAEGVILLHVFIISYSNDCGFVPVIRDGHSAGWVVFAQLGEPGPQFCPTIAPTSFPSSEPSNSPTDRPTLQPRPSPTRQPTSSPTAGATETPTPNPTRQPTPRPTNQPTMPPTKDPTNNPTASPTPEMTPRPTRDPTTPPTPIPRTLPPSTLPTAEPSRRPTTIPTASSSDGSTSTPSSLSTIERSSRPTTMYPTPKSSDGLTSLPTHNSQAPLTPTGSPTTLSTSETTIEPSGIPSVASAIPTIIAQFPTVDMSMSMRINFPFRDVADDGGDFRSLLMEQEDQLDLWTEYVDK